MVDNYILMHKTVPCGVIAIERDTGAFRDFEVINKKHVPFLGNADSRLMQIWWMQRAVPGSRTDMIEVMRRAGCENGMEYLAKNLALSITDTYWICPADIELSWNDVNLHLTAGRNGIVEFHSGGSYDPNASLGGQMHKHWDVSGGTPVLCKKAYAYYGQQSLNELFATEVHGRQAAGIPYVRYFSTASEDSAILSCCEAFTSEKVEFVSAYEVLRSRKLKSGRSDYDSIIDICEENGMQRALMQDFMDYMVVTDFALSNTDEHLQNFGVLRDSDTLELLGPAPLFDTGNSMFFSESGTRPLSRMELLDRRISSIHSSEEKMLKHVRSKTIVDADRLPSEDEVKRFYSENGIPEKKADFIAGSYSNKISLLRDFQSGISISLYSEKKKTDR